MNSNVTMMKMQKQLTDRSNAVTELEERFLQLQEVRCEEAKLDSGCTW